MSPFDADTTASINDAARRESVLYHLEYLTQEGIDRAFHDLSEKASVAAHSRKLKLQEEMSWLEDSALPETMHLLSTYSTETLEYTASQINDIKHEVDNLHAFMRNGGKWRNATKEHTEKMFRDAVFLRRTGLRPIPWESYAMFETYHAMDMEPGGMHLVEDERVLLAAVSILTAARRSRKLHYIAKTLEMHREVKNTDERSQRRKDLFSQSRRMDHLTSELVEYLKSYPEYGKPLDAYMVERKESLLDVHLDHFHDYVTSHTVLREGAL